VVEQASAAPEIFLDTPITVFAKCKNARGSLGNIKIKGKLKGQEREWEIDVLDSSHENLAIPVLWARERIRDLEESQEALGLRGSRQRERKQEKWKDMVLQLSKKYGILSRSASFVAIENRDEKDKSTGELVLRKIPVLVTVGWHGIGVSALLILALYLLPVLVLTRTLKGHVLSSLYAQHERWSMMNPICPMLMTCRYHN